jgi:hypothetical protein
LILGIGESFVHLGDKAVLEELIEGWIREENGVLDS